MRPTSSSMSFTRSATGVALPFAEIRSRRDCGAPEDLSVRAMR